MDSSHRSARASLGARAGKAALFVLGVAAVGSQSAAPVAARTWTNDQGDTLEASFVRLRGTTAFLRDADRKLVRAPIERLSEGDQQWIEQYKEFTAPRVWGDPAEGLRARFRLLRDDRVELKLASESYEVALEEMTAEDFAHVEALHTHLEKELPESFLTAQKAAQPSADLLPPEDGVERQWTDARGRSITAVYGGASGEKAILWIDGKRFDFPLVKLSADDRAWVAGRNLQNLANDLQDGWSAASSIVTTAVVRTIAQRGPPPMPKWTPPPIRPRPAATPDYPSSPADERFSQPPAAAPGQPASYRTEPTAPQHVSTAPNAAQRPAPPWISSIDELSDDEYDQRFAEAFGQWDYFEGDGIVGDAYCGQCEAEFPIPEGYTAGKPCPFCGVTLTGEEIEIYADYDDESEWRTPWYLRRTGRRILIFLVVTVIGAGVKVAFGFGGGGDD